MRRRSRRQSGQAQPYHEEVARHRLYTIGHSTHSIEEFVALLKAHGVEHLVDVRSIPKSRHCPQFNADALESSLGGAGIGYTLLKTLGGRRHSRKTSINTGWRNASFRGYADYMSTSGFAEGLAELIAIAEKSPTAIMCAEAVPWRCHRSLIADAMVVRGWEAREIISAAEPREHRLTPFLKVVDGRITYPQPDELNFI
ncbi:MAG TPA: DUF488 domain-containing protein [Terracidiphilus sp.]|nr:DUF488 domain-containing protein [Terracidiphilus sp.]